MTGFDAGPAGREEWTPPPAPGVGDPVPDAVLHEIEQILLADPRVRKAMATASKSDPRWVEIEIHESNDTVHRVVTAHSARIMDHADDPDKLQTLAIGWLG